MDYIIPNFDKIVRLPIQPLLPSLSADGKLGNPQLRAACNRGQGPFDTELSVLSYCMAYMYMHHDALVSVLDLPGNREKITQTGSAIIFDLGCGPGTAGVAIYNYLKHAHDAQRNFHYVGIDISQWMLYLAKQFMDGTLPSYSLFQSAPQAITWLDSVDVSEYQQFIITASYLYSQKAMSEDTASEMSALIKKAADLMPQAEGFFVSTNIDAKRARMHNHLPMFTRECSSRGIVLPKSAGSIPTGLIRKPKLKYRNTFFRDRADEDDKVCYVAGQLRRRPVDAALSSE